MNIGFDLDGVLYPWQQAVHNELIIYWKLVQDYDTFWYSGYKTYKNEMFWENLVRLEHLYSNQFPSKVVLNLVNCLAERNNIYYITNRPVEVRTATRNWLERYEFPSVNNLIFTDDKVIACDSLGIKLFVEDRPSNIQKLLDAGIETIIVEQPYNRDYIKTLDGKCKIASTPDCLERIFYEQLNFRN